MDSLGAPSVGGREVQRNRAQGEDALVASYRCRGRTLTPVDVFNTSAGQSDPYLNLFIRQPIPSSFLAGHMDVLMDLRNLLAQGYVPVMGADGHTVYLVQSARSVRGGVAFNF